jgi:predicted Zn-dependent protease
MLQFGGAQNEKLEAYVTAVGRRVTANTERPEVKYKFFVLDTPAVNAFALPGGYIYVTRGLLAQASGDGELAAVLAHETGHITARHAAAAYSRGMVAAMGTAIVAAGAGGATMAQMADMGSDIFTQAYSRSQENEADRLGIRYLSRAGYDPAAMANFLGALEVYQNLQKRLDGDADATADFFDTHPGTTDRIAQAKTEAAKYPEKPDASDRDRYLAAIDGVAYGDSDRQGFARGNAFWHPQMGFTFTVPEGFSIENQATQVVAKGQGAIAILDTVAIGWPGGPASYLRDKWMAGEKLDGVKETMVNGMKAATASFPGHVGGRPVTIMIAAIQWAPDVIFRFQIAMPQSASSAKQTADLQQMIGSLRRMTDAEKQSMRPWRIRVIAAQPDDTVASLAARMPFDKMNEPRFRALNGLKAGEQIAPGMKYKLVSAE